MTLGTPSFFMLPRLAWRFNLAPAWEPNAPNPYFVTGAGGDERLRAFYYDPCPRVPS